MTSHHAYFVLGGAPKALKLELQSETATISVPEGVAAFGGTGDKAPRVLPMDDQGTILVRSGDVISLQKEGDSNTHIAVRKQRVQPPGPKQARKLSGYQLFMREQTARVHDGKLSVPTDRNPMGYFASMWKECDQKTKDTYNARAAAAEPEVKDSKPAADAADDKGGRGRAKAGAEAASLRSAQPQSQAPSGKGSAAGQREASHGRGGDGGASPRSESKHRDRGDGRRDRDSGQPSRGGGGDRGREHSHRKSGGGDDRRESGRHGEDRHHGGGGSGGRASRGGSGAEHFSRRGPSEAVKRPRDRDDRQEGRRDKRARVAGGN